MKENAYWEAQPINSHEDVAEMRTKLDYLTNIEFSSRLLLGALYRQKQVNPVDYVYDALRTKIC